MVDRSSRDRPEDRSDPVVDPGTGSKQAKKSKKKSKEKIINDSKRVRSESTRQSPDRQSPVSEPIEKNERISFSRDTTPEAKLPDRSLSPEPLPEAARPTPDRGRGAGEADLDLNLEEYEKDYAEFKEGMQQRSPGSTKEDLDGTVLSEGTERSRHVSGDTERSRHMSGDIEGGDTSLSLSSSSRSQSRNSR